jgi:hypothetical protein
MFASTLMFSFSLKVKIYDVQAGVQFLKSCWQAQLLAKEKHWFYTT